MENNFDEEEILKMCKESPYFFAINFLKVNNKPFTTMMTEEEFNNWFKFTQKYGE